MWLLSVFVVLLALALLGRVIAVVARLIVVLTGVLIRLVVLFVIVLVVLIALVAPRAEPHGYVVRQSTPSATTGPT
jgi:hypothetical protein